MDFFELIADKRKGKQYSAALFLAAAFFTIFSFIIFSTDNVLAVKNLYEINYECPEGCVEGYNATWYINITNYGSDDLYFVGIKLINSISAETILENQEAEAALSNPDAIDSGKLLPIKVQPYETYMVVDQASLPAPNIGNNLSYRFCIKRGTPTHAWNIADPTSEFCFPKNYTIEMKGCNVDDDCRSVEHCLDSTCTALECKDCQYIENHSCFDYECCESFQCNLTQECVNNTCYNLECLNNTFLANHSCSEKPCIEGEIIVDYMCMEVNCSPDEYILNYSCTMLNCTPYEGIFNHSCYALNCSKNEGIIDHECVPISVCADDETIIDYQCKKLDCGPLRKAENHQCPINSVNFIQIMLLLILILLLFSDYGKFKHQHKKKLVRKLLSKSRVRKYIEAKKPDRKNAEEEEERGGKEGPDKGGSGGKERSDERDKEGEDSDKKDGGKEGKKEEAHEDGKGEESEEGKKEEPGKDGKADKGGAEESKTADGEEEKKEEKKDDNKEEPGKGEKK